MKDKEVKFEEFEISHTLGVEWKGRVQGETSGEESSSHTFKTIGLSETVTRGEKNLWVHGQT